MEIYKCKWKDNAQSPVMFMVDDFANVWVDENNDGKLDKGEDWGHWADDNNSMWDVLDKNILSIYPEVKTTLFTVVGKRSPIIESSKNIYTETILNDEKFLTFLRKLDKNPKIEIAYHGITHGITGKNRFEFTEEWQTYKSLAKAIEAVEKGKEIFYEALGRYPTGGKYCGYKFNGFSDQSISKTGFLWWCRHWDANIENGVIDGNLSYDLESFDGVVDIPSTIDGSYYSLKSYNKIFSKKYVSSLYKKVIYGNSIERLIKDRIKNNQIISIQEHSSPLRADNRVQYPNIITDLKNLKILFSYLKKYNLWYATGTEIAEYYLVNNKTVIKKLSDNEFIIETEKDFEGKEITIKIQHKSLKCNFIMIRNSKSEFVLNRCEEWYIGNIKVYNSEKYCIEEE